MKLKNRIIYEYECLWMKINEWMQIDKYKYLKCKWMPLGWAKFRVWHLLYDDVMNLCCYDVNFVLRCCTKSINRLWLVN